MSEIVMRKSALKNGMIAQKSEWLACLAEAAITHGVLFFSYARAPKPAVSR